MLCLATIAVGSPSTIGGSSNYSGHLRQHHHRLVISTECACVSRRCANLAVIRRLTRQSQRPGGLTYASLQQMFRSQGLVQRFSTHAGCFIAPRRRILLSSMVTAAASAPAADAGNNVLGEAIRKTYDIGSDETIRWGVLKSKVVPPPAQNGKVQTWQQYRKSTEKDRQELREQFAERLEVIAYPERTRRRAVGLALGVVTVALGAYLVSTGASPLQRAWVAPSLVVSLGFIDSSIQGLCTESWAGAWDVDDTGLEYMPNKQVAERIQEKVLKMYIRDSAISTALLAAFCFWPM